MVGLVFSTAQTQTVVELWILGVRVVWVVLFKTKEKKSIISCILFLGTPTKIELRCFLWFFLI